MPIAGKPISALARPIEIKKIIPNLVFVFLI